MKLFRQLFFLGEKTFISLTGKIQTSSCDIPKHLRKMLFKPTNIVVQQITQPEQRSKKTTLEARLVITVLVLE